MNTSVVRERLLEEVYRIPEDKLDEVYKFVHYFRIGIETARDEQSDVMRYAGCWQDMPEETFNQFIQDVKTRRQQAFSRRRSDETRID